MHGPSKQALTTNMAPQKSTALYKVLFFGPFRVMRDNQLVGEPMWRRNKAKALLKWFLLNTGRMFSADQLFTGFWPDMSKASAEQNFHVTIHYLRHLLEPDLPPRHESKYIRRNKDNLYWFELDETWWADIFDVHYHNTEAEEAEQRGERAAAIAHYRQIVEYCSLGFLHEDAYEDIFSPYRRHYERIHTEVLERLMHLYTQADMMDEALTYAHHALLVDPYCEPAIKAIAHVYFRQGNTAGAIHQLDYFQAFLREDLGIEPGEDILSLRKSIAEFEG
ncbi:MAG TPA: BTAD domain-containing putative transcriptional regulator [Ktedonobacteraceae bacterium]|nr:BTAD domain-containing putative transcriptional regulator [Ktedonobacteraceae bacterium]